MPTQLYKNSAIYFICARDFLWAGVEYKMGDEFDQDISPGRLDLLVRTRRIIPVVDDNADKPRHWHHHVWLRSQVTKKLGLIHDERKTTLQGSSLLNRQKQNELTFPSVKTDKNFVDQDVAADLQAEAHANAMTEKVLDDENAERFDDGCVGEHDPASNPDCDDAPAEPSDVGDQAEPTESILEEQPTDEVRDEDEVTEDDLYDPTMHSVNEVLDYLTGDISEDERQRVLAVERANKQRKGILDV